MSWNLREKVVEYAGWEMFCMRLFLLWPCLTVARRVVVGVQPQPNGLAHWISFAFMAQPAVQNAVVILFLVAAVFYLLDRFSTVALGVITAILVAKGTVINSQGAINHSLQLLTLVVLAQWIVQIAGWRRAWPRQQTQIQAVHWSKVVIAASYVSAGLAKLIGSGGMWLVYIPNLSVHMVKSNLQSYYTDLQPLTNGLVAQAPYWVAAHPGISRIILGAGLVLELGAFLALINRRWGLFVAVAILGLHESISYLMDIEFKNHVYLLIIFFINVPWLVYSLYQRIQRISPSSPAPKSTPLPESGI